ncbi:MAG: peptide chain release factor N(5)-glutamine methyltransferase [Proteobacteria bacterium]|nr:peptide chain release factor N(5)-glutamine methyltransferase [Pseudomonadota bacterium]
MTHIKTALEDATQKLAPLHETARLDAELLLARVLGRDRTWLHTWPDHALNPQQEHRFIQLLKRRASGEPVAHLLGRQAFWTLDLHVSSATLIPRPATERLVELALARIPTTANWRIADLGTGSGAIALALASERPACAIIATDLSAEALAVARTNAQELNLHNITFVEGDWLAPLQDEPPFQLIVSNPPYVCRADPHLSQGDVRFEPITALVAGEDGLDAIRILTGRARQHLAPGGWLLLEHGYDQADAVVALLRGAGFDKVEDFQDLAGQPRVAIARNPATLQDADT